MKTTVGHIADGFPPNGTYIGRQAGGPFGNPFVIGRDGDRAQVLAKFEAWFKIEVFCNPAYRSLIEGLRGRVLLCHCKPLPCHGDVIAAYLNG